MQCLELQRGQVLELSRSKKMYVNKKEEGVARNNTVSCDKKPCKTL